MYASNASGLGEVDGILDTLKSVFKAPSDPTVTPWYSQLLTSGTAMYTQYQQMRDMEKRRKAMEEYKRRMAAMAEQQKMMMQLRTAAPATMPYRKPSILPPSVMQYLPYIALGGVVIGGAVLLKRRRA